VRNAGPEAPSYKVSRKLSVPQTLYWQSGDGRFLAATPQINRRMPRVYCKWLRACWGNEFRSRCSGNQDGPDHEISPPCILTDRPRVVGKRYYYPFAPGLNLPASGPRTREDSTLSRRPGVTHSLSDRSQLDRFGRVSQRVRYDADGLPPLRRSTIHNYQYPPGSLTEGTRHLSRCQNFEGSSDKTGPALVERFLAASASLSRNHAPVAPRNISPACGSKVVPRRSCDMRAVVKKMGKQRFGADSGRFAGGPFESR
jgi:hypothetical protein